MMCDPDTPPAIFVPTQLLQRLMGDQAFAELLLDAFLEDTPKQLQRLAEQAGQGQLMEVKRLAHSLKGAAGNVNAPRLQQCAQALEHAVDCGDKTAVCAKLPELTGHFHELAHAIETFKRQNH